MRHPDLQGVAFPFVLFVFVLCFANRCAEFISRDDGNEGTYESFYSEVSASVCFTHVDVGCMCGVEFVWAV